MMNQLVKIISDDDGEPANDNSWHLVDPGNWEGPATLCTREFFGEGESAVVYEEKTVKRGGITCKKCLQKLKTYKKVRL